MADVQTGFTIAQLVELAAQTGFPDPNTAAAVAMAESGGVPSAIGDNGTSFGLWQVHTPAWPEFDPQQLLTANYNAMAALKISKGGTDWTPWSTFNSGAYLRYLTASPSKEIAKAGVVLFLSVAVAVGIHEGVFEDFARAARRMLMRARSF